MGIQMMGSQGDNNSSNNKQPHYQPLSRQNSMYSLTLDEVQNQLGDLGKPLSSMNLDELLKNVLTAEANQSFGVETDGAAQHNQNLLPRQGSLTINGAWSKKTVDEVWRDIQQSKNDGEKKSQDQGRQPTLGEITLEDFLVKAGVVAETSAEKNAPGVDATIPPQFPQGQWMQYPYQHPQQSMMGVYIPSQPMPPSMPIVATAPAVMDASYPENQVAPLMGTVSDSQTSARKRGAPEEFVEKNVERRQKRMIKNRESAARSRARKQAYTNELENKVSRLEEENERLRKRKELEKMLPVAPPPEPKYQLRRTSSAPL